MDENVKENINKNNLGRSIVVAALIIGGALVFTSQSKNINLGAGNPGLTANLEKIVLPEKGYVLPVTWGDLGKQMVEPGVIDKQKFENLYNQRGGLDEESRQLLLGSSNGRLVMTKANSGVLLNLLWGLGLSNKNDILEKSPMTDKRFGGAGNFASTGGWTLATDQPMNHYSRHAMIPLTAEQQSLVERVSQNIYRPCCGNSTHFPDCNHGMAMLGLLELMASQGVGEADIYKAALTVNAFWFPDTYLTIARFLAAKGIKWSKMSSQTLLSAEYSSGAGFQKIQNQVEPIKGGGGSCGV